MKLLPDAVRAALVANNRRRGDDHVPVVKFFMPGALGTWIVTELEPDGDTMFGLADLGEPELGYISLSELETFRGPMGLKVERDVAFRTTKPLSEWAKAARRAGMIVNPDR